MAAHAEGNSCTASGYFSHAEGYLCKAVGFAAHTEGNSCTASGSFAHAEGHSCEAKGEASHAEGMYTIAHGAAQHAAGRFNVEDTEDAFARVTGGGTAANKRKNIETLDWAGNLILGGNVTTGAGNDLDAVAAALAALEARVQALESK